MKFIFIRMVCVSEKRLIYFRYDLALLVSSWALFWFKKNAFMPARSFIHISIIFIHLDIGHISIFIHSHTHTHTHTCIYIYICMCVCVCVCIQRERKIERDNERVVCDLIKNILSYLVMPSYENFYQCCKIFLNSSDHWWKIFLK